MSKEEQSIRDLRENINHIKIHIIKVPERTERKGQKEHFLKYGQKHHKFDENINLHKVTQQNSITISSKKPIYRQVRIKLSKAKKGILKTAREKQLMYKCSSVILEADFLSETIEAKRWYDNIFKVLIYTEKLPLGMKEK